MGHYQIDVFRFQVKLFQYVIHGEAHTAHRPFENFLTFEIDRKVPVNRPEALAHGTGVAGHQNVPGITIATELVRQQAAFFITGLNNNRTRRVAEQHRHIAHGPVQIIGNAIDTDHHDPLHTAGAHHGRGQTQAIDKTSTGRIQIKYRRVGCAQLMLHRRRPVGNHVVRRRCSQNNHIDIGGIQPGRSQCPLACQRGQLGIFYMGNAPFLDTGARADPFIRGIHDLGQIFVGQNGWRQAFTPPGNIGVAHNSQLFRIAILGIMQQPKNLCHPDSGQFMGQRAYMYIYG